MFELWGNYKMENILDKHGSLRSRQKIIKKTVPVEYKVQDSKTIAQNADKQLGEILTTGTIQNEGEIEMFDLIPKNKPESPNRRKKGFVPNSVPVDITKNFKENDDKIIIKYETRDEIVEEKDEWTTSKIPFEQRVPRFDELKVTLIEFDGTQESKKVIEEGVEHLWWPKSQS